MEEKAKRSNGPLWVAAGSIVLILMMFFFLPTKNEEQKAVEKSRALSFEKISIPVLLKEARASLSDEERVYLDELGGHESDDSLKVINLKELSKEWFGRGHWILAGHYAQEVAQVNEKAESWGIAGSTFALGMQRYEEEDEAIFCRDKAIDCFEKAISLAPDEMEYRVNLAVCYAEKPEADNPMQGIMMLLDLDRNHPDQPKVLNTLAYYGLKTGQMEKAQGRLEKVLALDDNNQRANCLMARLLKEKGEIDKSIAFEKKCNSLTK